MLIRARCGKDINNLFNRYRDKCPSMRPPTSDDARDYRYRQYVCRKCHNKFGEVLTIKEHETKKVHCPKCQADRCRSLARRTARSRG